MTGIEWLVVLGAAGAIAWVNWYFFVAGRAVATAADDPGELVDDRRAAGE